MKAYERPVSVSLDNDGFGHPLVHLVWVWHAGAPNKTTLQAICSSRTVAERYVMGLHEDHRDSDHRVRIEERPLDHILGLSMGLWGTSK